MRKTLLAKAAFTLLAAFFGLTANAQTIVSDISATHIDESSAHLSWTGNATTLRYRVAGDSTVYNFDNSTLSPWTTFTRWTSDSYGGAWGTGNYHGTKFMWAIYSTDKTYHSYAAGTGLGRNGSKDMVISGSYCGDGTSAAGNFSDHGIEPDNYLVSPQVKLGGYISFWAKGMDPAECQENFGVFYTTSSTPNRNATWRQVGSDKVTTSEWTQYIFDLGSVTRTQDLGQNVYIAIRHYNCYDEDMLCVDDIILTAPGGDWITVTDFEGGTSFDLTGLDMLTNYQVEVQVGSTWKGTGFSTTTTNPVPSEVNAVPDAVGATISWWGKGTEYEVWYKSEPYDGPQYFYDDFEDDSKWSQWTVVTGSNNNSPYPWTREQVNTAQLKFTDHSGTKSVGSFSWKGQTDYQSNCYLITPKVLIGNKVKFWVRCNPGYPDKFEVVLSTSGNTIADFTGENSATRHILRELAPAPAVDEWRRISLDVPEEFVDKQGYIAIHHNHYGGNYLIIDDFGIFEPDIPGSGVWTKLVTTDDHIEIGKLIPNTPYDYYIVSNKDGVVDPTPARVETDIFHFTTDKLAELVLEDNGQNSPAITALGGGTVQTLTLKDRTLKANTWNTLCLPVNVELTPVTGGYNWTGTSTKVDVRQLKGATYNEETQTLTLNFSAANEISILKAGVPYIVKPNANISGEYLTLTERIIKAGMEPVTITIVEGDEENEEVSLMFRGTYDKVAFTSEDRSVLFVKSNKLVFPVANSYVNAQRALFYFKGAHVGNAIGNLVKEIKDNLDDEDPTGIEELFGIETAGTWYDLNGRKLNGKPAQKGIYINNGKKTIIK